MNRYERGEAGCVPLLRGDFYRLVNVALYENASLPKACTPGGFSSSWTSCYDQSWRRLLAKAKEQHQESSLVDFLWRRAKFPQWLEKGSTLASSHSSTSASPLSLSDKPTERPGAAGGGSTAGVRSRSPMPGGGGRTPRLDSPKSTPDSHTAGKTPCGAETDKHDAVTCMAIPIDFEPARGEGQGMRDGWRIILGSATSGTCFRSATPSAFRRRDEQWRKNAIANLYYCPIVYRGRTVLNVMRHGVVGFTREPSAHVTTHLDLTMRHVLGEQCKAGLPLRVVSVNLLSHYKATGEPDMMERQMASFQDVMRRLNAKHLGSDSREEGGLPKGLPLVQYAHLLLPGNTDQWEMGADYNRRKNVECKLLFLQWVCDDAVFALKRLLVKGASTEAGPSGPGGVHAASVEAPLSSLHWPPLRKDTAAMLQATMVLSGTGDKSAIIDCITWGDVPIDWHFKQTLLLPIVSAPDDEVWDTFIRQIPEYVRKRLDTQLRSARMDLELSGPDTRAVEVVRSTVVLMRHILHILSTILGLVHRRVTRLASQPSHFRPGAGTGGASHTLQRNAGGEADDGTSDDNKSHADVAADTHVDEGGTTENESDGKDSEREREGGCEGGHGDGERDGDDDNEHETGHTTGMSLQLSQHVSELERARMSVNLLRTLVQAELGMWEGGFVCFASEAKHEDATGSDDKTQEKRRRFSRATSLSVSSLLNQTLGVVVFINCKSGLDRTGLQTGIQACQSALWTLYPQQRWGLHLAAINWHLLQSRHSAGEDHFNQPWTADSFSTEQDRLNWFRSLLRERSLIRTHRMHTSSTATVAPGDRNVYSDDALLFEDNVRMLKALYPLRSLFSVLLFACFYVCTSVCMHVRACFSARVCPCACASACVSACASAHVCECECVCFCSFVCNPNNHPTAS